MPAIAHVNSSRNIRFSLTYGRDSVDSKNRKKSYDQLGINCSSDDATDDFQSTQLNDSLQILRDRYETISNSQTMSQTITDTQKKYRRDSGKDSSTRRLDSDQQLIQLDTDAILKPPL